MATKENSERQLENGVARSDKEQDISNSPAGTSSEDNDVPVDPNIVDWNGPDDPENPLNWSKTKKNLHVVIVSLFTLVA